MIVGRPPGVVPPASGGPAAPVSTMEVTVIYVHGVGMSPELFEPISRLIGRPHQVWERPGYGTTPATSSLGGQYRELAGLVSENEPAVVVGVSGGATLALASAVRGAKGLAGIVTHEPLVGRLEPELDTMIQRARVRFARRPSRSAVVDFLSDLYGDATWRALPESARAWTLEHHERVGADIAQFASFQPTRAGLTGIRVPHLTTVGSESGAPRQRVADLLAETGAVRRTIEGAGHLPLAEHQLGLARVVDEFLERGVAVA